MSAEQPQPPDWEASSEAPRPSTSERIVTLIREAAALRREIILEEKTSSAIIVYALASLWLTEYVTAEPGYLKILNSIAEASSVIIGTSSRPELEKMIDEILGEKGTE